MFADEARRAIAASPLTGLDALSKSIWQAYGAGAVNDAEASELCELIAARRAVKTAPQTPRRSTGPRPRSDASLERRRRWVASGWLPPTLACRFTQAEAAVLSVIAAEVTKAGRCVLPIGALAALAGVGKTTVRTALHQARTLGLLTVEERRLSAFRSDTNVVRIVSGEWRTWLSLGRGRKAEGGGSRTAVPTSIQLQDRPQQAPRYRGSRRVEPSSSRPFIHPRRRQDPR